MQPSWVQTCDPATVTWLNSLMERCEFVVDLPVRCAVSGGADSSALLVLATLAGCEVTAVHLDHGLRPDSEAEIEVVAALAQRFGAAFESHRMVIEPGPNLESRARQARHEVLGPSALFGHTADDRVETLLMFLLRGMATAGWATLRDARHPIIELTRSETEEVCARLAIHPISDPMNRDPSFTRTRIRHELIPLMNSIAQREVRDRILSSADAIAELDDLARIMAAALDVTDALQLAQAPPAVARRALAEWFHTTSDTHYRPSGAALDRMLSVARGDAVACDITGGWRLERSHQRLRLVQS